MCTVWSSGDVQTKFYLLPHFLNHVSCYSFNGWCDPFLQVLDIPYLLRIHNVFNVPPQEKIKWREIWASRWPGYWSIGPPLPIQASGNLSFKTSVTKQPKWGGGSVLHKNNPTYSFLFEGFNMWKSHPSFSMTLYMTIIGYTPTWDPRLKEILFVCMCMYIYKHIYISPISLITEKPTSRCSVRSNLAPFLSILLY